MGERRIRVVCVASAKGGVGKTTTTVHLAAGLAGVKARVLVIDAEPQQNAAMALLGVSGDPYADGVAEILTGTAGEGISAIAALVQPSNITGVDVLPPGILDPVTSWLASQRAGELLIRKRIVDIVDAAGVYDWILLDTPPALSELTGGCLVATGGHDAAGKPRLGGVVSPLRITDPNALRGVQDVADALNDLTDLGTGGFTGVVITDAPGRLTATQQEVLAVAAEQKWRVIGRVRRSELVPKAAAAMRTVFESAPKSTVAEDMRGMVNGLKKAVR